MNLGCKGLCAEVDTLPANTGVLCTLYSGIWFAASGAHHGATSSCNISVDTDYSLSGVWFDVFLKRHIY